MPINTQFVGSGAAEALHKNARKAPIIVQPSSQPRGFCADGGWRDRAISLAHIG